MRAFPSGMRVRSDNLDPAVFWRKGVQLVALNWQRWDQGMMLNEAMFAGSEGWVLKPNGYRGKKISASAPGISTESQANAIAHKTLTLNIEVLAAQDIPLPLDGTKPDGFHPYVKCELHVEKPSERTGAPIEGAGKSKDGEYKWKSRTMKGTEVDFFEGEKVEFREIPGVVEELSFLRYVARPSSPYTEPLFPQLLEKRGAHCHCAVCRFQRDRIDAVRQHISLPRCLPTAMVLVNDN